MSYRQYRYGLCEVECYGTEIWTGQQTAERGVITIRDRLCPFVDQERTTSRYAFCYVVLQVSIIGLGAGLYVAKY